MMNINYLNELSKEKSFLTRMSTFQNVFIRVLYLSEIIMKDDFIAVVNCLSTSVKYPI